MKKILLLIIFTIIFSSFVSALTLDDVVANYNFNTNTSAIIFDSLENNNGNLTNGAFIDTTEKKLGAGSLSCDGTDDYVILSDNDDVFDFGSGEFSFNYWAWADGSQSGAPSIFSRELTATYDTYIGFQRFRSYFTQDGASWVTNAPFNFVPESQAGHEDSTWRMYTLIKTSSNRVVTYVNGAIYGNESSTFSTLADTQAYICGGQLGAKMYGQVDELTVWKGKALNSTEISELYNSGTGLEYPWGLIPSNETITDSVESTAVVKQIGTVTLLGPAPQIIVSSTYNLTVNDTDLYGGYTFNVLSNQNNDLFCELYIDGEIVKNVSRSNVAGIIGGVRIQSNIFNQSAENHTQMLECRRIGAGSIVVSNAVGIGHILLDELNITITHSELLVSDNVSSGSSFTEIGEINITIGNLTDGPRYHSIILEGGLSYINNHGVEEVLATYIEINDSFNCSITPRTVGSGNTGSVSSDCMLENVTVNGTYKIEFFGNGTNANYEGNIISKAFFLSDEELAGGTGALVGLTWGGSNDVKLFNLTGGNINHALANVFQKVGYSIKTNQTTEVNTWITLNNTAGNFYRRTINFTRSFEGGKIGNLIGQDSFIGIPEDNYTLEVWANCGGATCEMMGGSSLGYITDVTTTLINAFNVSVFDNGNGNVISTFTVTDGATFSTTTGSLLYSSSNLFENLTIVSNNYFSALIYNHNTTNDLTVNLNQTYIKFICSEKITGKTLNCSDNLEDKTFNPSVADNPNSIFGNVSNYFSETFFFNVTALQNQTLNITKFASSNISIVTTTNFGTVNNCTYNVTNDLYPDWNEIIFGTPNNNVLLINGTYNITADCEGTSVYALQTKNLLVENTTQTLNFGLLSTNSVNITFYDSNTNNLLTGINVTIQFIGETRQTNITNTSNLYVDLLNPSEYTLVYEAPNYRQNTYIFTLNNRSFTELYLYLEKENNTQLGLITVKDVFGKFVSNADVTIQRYENNAWITEQIRRTDFQGRTEAFFVVSTAFYNFLVSVDDVTYFGVINNDANKKQIYAEDITNGIEIIIDTEPDDTISSYQNIYDISTSFSFVNTTNTTGYFRLIWDDSNNIQRNVNITVFRDGIFNCSSFASSESGTIFCFVGDNNTAFYQAYAYIDEILVGTSNNRLGISDERIVNWGSFGFGLALLLVLLSFFMFSDNPTVSIMSGTIMFTGLIFFNVIFKNFNFAIISLILVLGWIVASIKSSSGVNG